VTEVTEEVAAAEGRVAAFLDALARLPDGAFVSTSLPAPTRETEAATDEAARLAAAHGLSELLAEARDAARRAVLRRYDEGGYRPTMVGLNWGVSEGRAQDRMAGVVAVEDAITATVIERWASEDLLTALASPFEVMQRGGEVAPTFDLSEATARRLQAGRAGRAGRGTARVLVVGGFLVVAVIAFAAGSWALVGLAVIATAAVGGGLAQGR
jgi:hypothetical protein